MHRIGGDYDRVKDGIKEAMEKGLRRPIGDLNSLVEEDDDRKLYLPDFYDDIAIFAIEGIHAAGFVVARVVEK